MAGREPMHTEAGPAGAARGSGTREGAGWHRHARHQLRSAQVAERLRGVAHEQTVAGERRTEGG
eukprot:10392661-Lingulodinium_polyedra.AAC.1